MPTIRDDEIPSATGIPSGARRTDFVPPPTLAVTEELLHALPKTDLHCHLDGSMRVKTILELAEQQKVKLPSDTVDGLAKAIHMGEVCESLEEYLVAFDVTLSVLQTADALYRAAYELAVDAAAENVRWLEVRYSPALHLQKGLKMTTVIDSVLEGLRVAKRETGIKCGVIVCGIRHINPQTSMRLAELSVAYKNRGVIGFDLAGAEASFPAKDHKDAFQLILKNNVNCTAHAGEAYGPESISQAIHNLGSHRIGHGTRLREDGDLLNYVNDHRIPLEVCPTSNVQTGAVSSLAAHPLKFYFDYGLRVTINTDNRLITDTTVTKELWVAHKELGLSLDDLATIIVSGFKSAFLPFREKQDMLRLVNEEIATTLAAFDKKRHVPVKQPA
ncbi:adenosine deaminase [Myxococcus sp. CA051A]|uniref:adenosine deaminase n=1 Tax=Myxococcus llanfairpwllgwyngyllgogerychwyrndrobwllllantysiliogogogochensis TaxID=2590453 RepID=A0A540X476_9BACT|nr:MULTISPECIES: adenosine deaminase [Myxococcus]NTX04832.1 adenosine deaminase [Myxococcus sp. CA040A]NTX15177.1 adenosine deaminase [Myxococcus sp. CA056]NTX36177.1 adenosine deaminase [Myxococcus sp. CA033]NTX52413.1 adenosine deaminase [Myxococcus sp. CA039A]NTX63906.1 adenosine deaminase [Myxococcus sp. CA051A]